MASLHSVAPARALPAAVGLAAVGGYVATLSWAMEHTAYNVWGAFISVPLLVLVSVPLLRRAVRAEPDRWFRQVIAVAFAVKLLGGLVRYFVVTTAYGGVADASQYDAEGQHLAHLWLHGQFTDDVGGRVVGSGFPRFVTAAVYTITGPSKISGYVVFSWFGFWGLYLSYRAFRTAVPEGDHGRYALLVFFLPSLLFWPSTIGKEAWMTLCVGLAAFGAARVYMRRRAGYLLLALGLAGGAMVRPHVVVFVIAGILVGYVLAPRRRRGPASAFWKALGIVVLTVTAFILLSRAADFFGLTHISREQIDSTIRSVAGRTAGGGSQFAATPVNSPADFPLALVTVLFRPFPWEAHNVQGVVTSVEGLFLIALLASSWRRLAQLPWLAVRQPYVALSVLYIVLFVYAFSAFSNFGILARERVQVLPFVLALAALPHRRASVTTTAVGRHRGSGVDLSGWRTT